MNDYDDEEDQTEEGGISIFWAIAMVITMFGILAWSGLTIWG